MSQLTYRGRIELGVAAVTITVGLLFVALASTISSAAFDPIGPRALPLFLAACIVALGAAIGVAGWRDRTPDAALSADYGFRSSDLAQVAQVIGAGLVYLALFFALGYMAATLLAFPLVLFAFGARRALVMLALSLFAAVLYQYVFMGLMGLNDPAGGLLDLRVLSREVAEF